MLPIKICQYFISADLSLAVSEPELQVDEGGDGGDGDSFPTLPHNMCVQERRIHASVPSYLQL